MKSGLGRFFIHALATLVILVLALFVFSRFGGREVAIGNLVLRTQKGASYPLSRPDVADFEAPRWRAGNPKTEAAEVHNVVFFIGDGMGLGHISAASDLLGGPGGTLAMTDTSHVGLVRTWARDTLITDSAASGTSLATGFKTDKRMVSMLPDGSIPLTLIEAANERGFTTGVITTSGLVDATPASFTAHVAHRDSFEGILSQMFGSQTAVLIGGDYTEDDDAKNNARYLELAARAEELAGASGFHVIRDPDALLSTPLPVLALFPPRGTHAEQHGPHLAVSARRVVELMLADESPFFLVIESELTDTLAHDNDIEGVMDGMLELDASVAAVLDLVGQRGDTLVVVTADHDTGGLSLVDGYYDDEEAVVRWSTSEHTSQWVPLFAFGPGAEAFAEVLDNTEIAVRIAHLLGFENFPSLADLNSN
jgi:alkaline phosphatase